MEDSKKIIIYQVLTRLFGNRNQTRKENGSVAENGVGKMEDFTPKVLKQIRDLGVNGDGLFTALRHTATTRGGGQRESGFSVCNNRLLRCGSGSCCRRSKTHAGVGKPDCTHPSCGHESYYGLRS